MATINPYLTFSGNCEEAFNFYKSVFGGEFQFIGRFSEMPTDSENALPPEDMDKIMHIGLPIGKETVLFGSDVAGEWAGNTVIGNNISISISAESKEEADRLFQELSVGGIITMAIENTFWGSYFGMFTDKFNINWMVGWSDSEQ